MLEYVRSLYYPLDHLWSSLPVRKTGLQKHAKSTGNTFASDLPIHIETAFAVPWPDIQKKSGEVLSSTLVHTDTNTLVSTGGIKWTCNVQSIAIPNQPQLVHSPWVHGYLHSDELLNSALSKFLPVSRVPA